MADVKPYLIEIHRMMLPRYFRWISMSTHKVANHTSGFLDRSRSVWRGKSCLMERFGVDVALPNSLSNTSSLRQMSGRATKHSTRIQGWRMGCCRDSVTSSSNKLNLTWTWDSCACIQWVSVLRRGPETQYKAWNVVFVRCLLKTV